MKKRKAQDLGGGISEEKRQRPSPTEWPPEELAAFLKTCGDTHARSFAATVIAEDIDGALASKLTGDGLKELGITSMGAREKVQATLNQLSDVHFPAFLEFDKDNSGEIDAKELASMLTTVKGHLVTAEEAKPILNAADTNLSGGVDFDEFKHIIKESNPQSDWGKACMAAGLDQSLLDGRKTPPLIVQAIYDWIGGFLLAVLGFFTIGIYPLWVFFVLNGRGMTYAQSLFGTETINAETGKPAGWLIVACGMLFLETMIGYTINALCPMYTYAPAQPQSQQVALSWGDLSLYWPSNTDPGLPTPVWNVHWFYLACLYHAMNIGTGLMDPRGQRLTDQVLGIRVVYQQDKAQQLAKQYGVHKAWFSGVKLKQSFWFLFEAVDVVG